MNRKSLFAFLLLAGSLLFGTATDLLFNGFSLGLNVPIWTALVLLSIHLTLKTRDASGIRSQWQLAASIMLFALLFAWRDSPTLKLMDGAALSILVSLMAARIRYEWTAWQSFTEYAARICKVFCAAIMGPIPAARQDIEWGRFKNEDVKRSADSIARGLVITLPIVTIFAVLLTMADSRFEAILTQVARIDFGSGITHLLAILCCAWLASGVLRDISQRNSQSVAVPNYTLALGPIEVGILLGMVNALFAAFVLLQIPYLFGGYRPADASIAEYARRGFFELVWVSALVLPLLLHTHAALRNAGKGGEQMYRALAGAMVAFVFVILASAAHRMVLYRSEFGLTELRLYTTAFICWLGIVFAWFVPTVLWGLRHCFAFGASISALAIVPVLHFVNPDAAIVRENAARLAEGKQFDSHYNTSLSADAVPELLKVLSRIRSEETDLVRTSLMRVRDTIEGDWREWSISRARALHLLRDLRAPVAATHTPYYRNPAVNPGRPWLRHVPYTDEDRKRVLLAPLTPWRPSTQRSEP